MHMALKPAGVNGNALCTFPAVAFVAGSFLVINA